MTKKKKINWETIDNQMKNLKFPLTFLFNIIKKQSNIEDYELSLIIRFFFKNQLDLVIDNPIFVILNFLDKKFVISHQIVKDFYSSLIKKHVFIKILVNYKKVYDNKEYWSQPFSKQKQYLNSNLLRFKSFFNSSFTEFAGFTKFVSQLKVNNPELNNIIKSSVRDTINLFGLNFFKVNNIKLISDNEYDKLEIKYKIKYISYYYMKVVKIVNYLINIYDLLNSYDIKLKQLINPRPMYFNIGNIYSENDTEDMELLFGN